MRRTAALIAVAVLVLAGCTAGSTDPDGSTTPAPGATADAPGADASATPDATATSDEEPADEPDPTPSEDSNDPGDGVVRDEPVTVATPTAEGQVIRVDVSITRWGVDGDRFVAAGVVEGLVEDGGSCTMTLEGQSGVLVAVGEPARSASSMSCAPGLEVPLSRIDAGTYRLTVSYASDSYRGESAPKQVEIP